MRKRFVDIGADRLECAFMAPEKPDSPTLVFLHDGLGCLATWRSLPVELAQETGCGALVYSRAGYGASSRRPGPWPLRFMHDEALVTLPALLAACGVTDAIFIGHSDGASIALLAAGAKPWVAPLRLRGLALEAPHVFVEPICLVSIEHLSATYRSSGLAESMARYHGAQADECFVNWSGAWLDPAFRDWNIEDCLPHVDVPVLVIQGKEDEFGTAEQVRVVLQGVRDRSSFRMLAGVGHSPHRDRRDEVMATWTAFVGGLL